MFAGATSKQSTLESTSLRESKNHHHVALRRLLLAMARVIQHGDRVVTWMRETNGCRALIMGDLRAGQFITGSSCASYGDQPGHRLFIWLSWHLVLKDISIMAFTGLQSDDRVGILEYNGTSSLVPCGAAWAIKLFGY